MTPLEAIDFPFSPEGKHTITPPPHLWYVSPALCSRPVIFLRGNRHRPDDESHFLRPPKLAVERALRFPPPPPPNRTMCFAPPLCEFPRRTQCLLILSVVLPFVLLVLINAVVLYMFPWLLDGTQRLRGLRMRGWILRGWIWRFWGAYVLQALSYPDNPYPLN